MEALDHLALQWQTDGISCRCHHAICCTLSVCQHTYLRRVGGDHAKRHTKGANSNVAPGGCTMLECPMEKILHQVTFLMKASGYVWPKLFLFRTPRPSIQTCPPSSEELVPTMADAADPEVPLFRYRWFITRPNK